MNNLDKINYVNKFTFRICFRKGKISYKTLKPLYVKNNILFESKFDIINMNNRMQIRYTILTFPIKVRLKTY